MTGMASRKPAFAFIFVSALMSAVSFSIVVPILPALIRQLSGGDMSAAATWMMFFASGWGAAQIACSPLLGAISDRFGRRPVLLISTVGLGVDYILMALAPNLWVLLLGRLISGATSASLSTAHAYVADISDQEGRADLFGKLASSISVGYLLGPVLGGWLGEIDLRVPFLAASAVTFANSIYGLVALPESLPREKRSATFTVRNPYGRSGIALLLKSRTLTLLAVISFFGFLSNMLYASVWVLFCTLRFGWSPLGMGIAIFAAGAAGVGVQMWAVGRIVAAVGERMALLIGAAVSCLSLAYVAFAPSTLYYALSVAPAALGLLFGPGLQGLISGAAGPNAQGTVRGGIQALSGIATILGPIAYGSLFSWSIDHNGDYDISGISVLLSSAFMGCAFLIARHIPKGGANSN